MASRLLPNQASQENVGVWLKELYWSVTVEILNASIGSQKEPLKVFE